MISVNIKEVYVYMYVRFPFYNSTTVVFRQIVHAVLRVT